MLVETCMAAYLEKMPSPLYGHRQPVPEVRKMIAEEAIASVLTTIRAGELTYDEWVKDCLAHAVSADWRGLYDLACAEAQHAMTPPAQRSPYAPAPASPPITFAQIQQMFTTAKDAPAREHPIF